MDPHGNMSRRLVDVLDLATSHRMSPHEDAARTRERAIANLVRCLRERIAPRRAWVRVPVLLAGERACTRDEPARGIYGRLAEVERRDGIIDAAVWIGYAWADEPRCGAAVVVAGTSRWAARSARPAASAWRERWRASREMRRSAATSRSSDQVVCGRSSRPDASRITRSLTSPISASIRRRTTSPS